ncbi:hypothetical protein [Pseudomonas sp. FEN]|nr:hypothetical protein [Pseudomonas sp. FEN]
MYLEQNQCTTSYSYYLPFTDRDASKYLDYMNQRDQTHLHRCQHGYH